jgi:hypothetical protein
MNRGERCALKSFSSVANGCIGEYLIIGAVDGARNDPRHERKLIYIARSKRAGEEKDCRRQSMSQTAAAQPARASLCIFNDSRLIQGCRTGRKIASNYSPACIVVATVDRRKLFSFSRNLLCAGKIGTERNRSV